MARLSDNVMTIVNVPCQLLASNIALIFSWPSFLPQLTHLLGTRAVHF